MNLSVGSYIPQWGTSVPDACARTHKIQKRMDRALFSLSRSSPMTAHRCTLNESPVQKPRKKPPSKHRGYRAGLCFLFVELCSFRSLSAPGSGSPSSHDTQVVQPLAQVLRLPLRHCSFLQWCDLIHVNLGEDKAHGVVYGHPAQTGA